MSSSHVLTPMMQIKRLNQLMMMMMKIISRILRLKMQRMRMSSTRRISKSKLPKMRKPTRLKTTSRQRASGRNSLEMRRCSISLWWNPDRSQTRTHSSFGYRVVLAAPQCLACTPRTAPTGISIARDTPSSRSL